MATVAENLATAEAALVALLTGKAVTEFRDSNGEYVKYSQADLASLRAYIAELKAQLAGTPGGPLRPFF